MLANVLGVEFWRGIETLSSRRPQSPQRQLRDAFRILFPSRFYNSECSAPYVYNITIHVFVRLKAWALCYIFSNIAGQFSSKVLQAAAI